MSDIRDVVFNVMDICGFYGYFTVNKIDFDTIPEGLHAYELEELECVDCAPIKHQSFIGTFISFDEILINKVTGSCGTIVSSEDITINDILLANERMMNYGI